MSSLSWLIVLCLTFQTTEAVDFPNKKSSESNAEECKANEEILIDLDGSRCREHNANQCSGRSQCLPELTNSPCKEDIGGNTVPFWCVQKSKITDECNRNSIELDSESGHIQNPGYPGTSKGQSPCLWHIKRGRKYEITLFDVKLDCQRKRQNNILLIEEVTTEGTIIKRIFYDCKCTGINTFRTTGGTVKFRLQYDGESNFRGIWIYYKALPIGDTSTPVIHIPLYTAIDDLSTTAIDENMSETTDNTLPMDQGSFIGIALGGAFGGLVLVVSIIVIIIFRKAIFRKLHKKPRPESTYSAAELEDNPLYTTESRTGNGTGTENGGSGKSKKKNHPYEEIPVRLESTSGAAKPVSTLYAEIPDTGYLGNMTVSKSQEGISGHFYAEIPADKKQAQRNVSPPLKASQEDFYSTIPGENVIPNEKSIPSGNAAENVDNGASPAPPGGDGVDTGGQLVEYAVVDLAKKHKDREEKKVHLDGTDEGGDKKHKDREEKKVHLDGTDVGGDKKTEDPNEVKESDHLEED